MTSQVLHLPKGVKSMFLLRKQLFTPLGTIGCQHIYGRSKIGKREVVGFGVNGTYTYFDVPDVPMPAIRFREADTQISALREKEKGDWKQLTIDDKKKLYRFSFCRTYAEMMAPTGEWKSILAGVLAIVTTALWTYVLIKKFVYAPMPESTSLEWRKKQRDWMVLWKVNPIEGLSSKYDYEKNRWKD
ncbi:unnamed protein product [Medioppia subpectinata]|uniref:Cytochrome c oxidase subunit 4 n=2 Tax=Medioppia subpectinata TaxID=1979941 RepID=A0A7R9PWZ0_9ACAR|nr:unnamed protein product [Medioppia subpectinata]CAG2103418.1 unnamed protein product [Medioppia subpectinata]